jgi:pimeloyl-ACP methyl ester carboxylesterase
MASFGGMLAVPNDYPTSTDPDTVAASVWYHYSHAELLDGPGAGESLFAPSSRAAVSAFVRSHCDEAAVAALGKDTGAFFDPGFVLEIGAPAGANLPCVTARCTTWKARYADDRPHITGDAAKVPILLVHGDADDWIPPERARCGFDRLVSDGAAVSFCIVPSATHDQAVGVRSEYAAQWIAWRTLGGAEPASCGGGVDALHGANGAVAACAALPPND